MNVGVTLSTLVSTMTIVTTEIRIMLLGSRGCSVDRWLLVVFRFIETSIELKRFIHALHAY